MIVYLADTRSRKLLEEMRTRRAGMMIVRGRLRGRTSAVRWAYDNGAWADFVAQKPFDLHAWKQDVEAIGRLPTPQAPDFCVLPDIVAGGKRSLDLSMSWIEDARKWHWNWFLPVQDGMTPENMPREVAQGDIDHLMGIFVGGSTRWKLEHAASWARWGRSQGYLLHVGRVGTAKRVRHMRAIGASSIDSALPLFSRESWRIFWDEVNSPQADLFTPRQYQSGAPKIR